MKKPLTEKNVSNGRPAAPGKLTSSTSTTAAGTALLIPQMYHSTAGRTRGLTAHPEVVHHPSMHLCADELRLLLLGLPVLGAALAWLRARL